MTHSLLIDVLGWICAVLILIAYGMISGKRVDGHSRKYQSLNVVGSACLIVNAAYYQAYPSAFVNVVWIVIGTVTLLRVMRPRPGA